MQQDGQNYWQGDQAEPVLQTSEDYEVESAPVSWEASEYVHHEKDFIWFLCLVLISAVLIVASIFLVQSLTFTALIVVMAIATVVFALRPPRTLNYSVTSQALHINEKTYSLHDFRAFGVVQDGPLFSIVLLPIKRFMPAVTVYFPPDQGEQIVDTLGRLVPIEKVKLDAIDRLVRKLRF